MPGTTPLTLIALDSTVQPASRLSAVTSTRTSSRSAIVPFFASWLANAIEKQLAWAAASSSSGLVRPSWAAVREPQVIGIRENAPLEMYWSIPEPSVRLPLHVAVACRVSAIGSLLA